LEDNLLEFSDVLHLAWGKARRMAAIASQIEGALTGESSCRDRVEARLLLGYLQMSPLSASREVVDLPHGRVMIFDMYYDGDSVFKLFE